MRVLWIDHPESDWLASIVFMGLVQELGHENVIDWPYKKMFHGETHKYRLPNNRDPSGALHSATGFDWDREDGADGNSAPLSWQPGTPGHRLDFKEVADQISSFDLVILASPRPFNSAALQQLLNKVGRHAIRRLVMLDGEDYTDIRHDFINFFHPSVYFKRELLPNQSAACRILPCPFASPLGPTVPKVKDIDILFLCGNTDPVRNQICDKLRERFGSRFLGGVGNHLGYPEYLDALNRSKIAVSCRGFGHDTLRYWEIPSFEHTLLLCDKLPIVKPFPGSDGVHWVQFNDGDHLVATVDHYLNCEERRYQVSENGNNWLLQHHTARARAKYVLEESFK